MKKLLFLLLFFVIALGAAEYRFDAEKLIKNQLVSFIGTDAHSPDKRPPMMKQALEVIAKKIGTEYPSGFIRNSQTLLEQIG